MGTICRYGGVNYTKVNILIRFYRRAPAAGILAVADESLFAFFTRRINTVIACLSTFDSKSVVVYDASPPHLICPSATFRFLLQE